MKQHKIDASAVTGTGKEGRITKEDVMAFLEKGATKEAPAASSATASLSPAVRNLLKSHKIDASSVKGTGKEGRITKEDVMAFLEKGATKETPAAAPAPAPK